MKQIIFGILLVFINCVNAQESQDVFEQANLQYQKEAYNKAIANYKEVLDTGVASAELYFNLGNAYYKTNKIAQAIYYYEKSLQLNPSNKDVKVNLAYANRGIIDSIKKVPKSMFEKINDTVLAALSYNSWAKLAVVFSLLAGAFWMLFFFSIQPTIKKTGFTLGVVISIACFVSLGITWQQHKQATKRQEAIIFANKVLVKNAPRESASEVFTLHEGTKVKVMDEVGDWQKIKIADGQVGWLQKKTIKIF